MSYNKFLILLGFLVCFYLTGCGKHKRPRVQTRPHTVVTNSSVSAEGVEKSVISGRLEIPKLLNPQDEQLLDYIGYSVSYNRKTRLPNWVAWELTREEALGTVPRKNDFRRDPRVRGAQADICDYKKSGWDRGHMAPAGDMKWSKQAMSESFYFTNMCPQNPNLNGGDWKDLEEKCRTLATKVFDNIYIVCGPIVGNAKCGTIGPNKVVIPDAFYKVLLTDIAGEYQTIGFVFKNQPGNKNLGDYAYTVDEIELITGCDFFEALPDSIESLIESDYNLIFWGL